MVWGIQAAQHCWNVMWGGGSSSTKEKAGNHQEMLQRAITEGDLANWDSEMSVDSLLPNGEYPLHYAARIGELGIVKELVAHGAQLNQIDKQGLTATDHVLYTHDADLIFDWFSLIASTGECESLRFMPDFNEDLRFKDTAEGKMAHAAYTGALYLENFQCEELGSPELRRGLLYKFLPFAILGNQCDLVADFIELIRTDDDFRPKSKAEFVGIQKQIGSACLRRHSPEMAALLKPFLKDSPYESSTILKSVETRWKANRKTCGQLLQKAEKIVHSHIHISKKNLSSMELKAYEGTLSSSDFSDLPFEEKGVAIKYAILGRNLSLAQDFLDRLDMEEGSVEEQSNLKMHVGLAAAVAGDQDLVATLQEEQLGVFDDLTNLGDENGANFLDYALTAGNFSVLGAYSSKMGEDVRYLLNDAQQYVFAAAQAKDPLKEHEDVSFRILGMMTLMFGQVLQLVVQLGLKDLLPEDELHSLILTSIIQGLFMLAPVLFSGKGNFKELLASFVKEFALSLMPIVRTLRAIYVTATVGGRLMSGMQSAWGAMYTRPKAAFKRVCADSFEFGVSSWRLCNLAWLDYRSVKAANDLKNDWEGYKERRKAQEMNSIDLQKFQEEDLIDRLAVEGIDYEKLAENSNMGEALHAILGPENSELFKEKVCGDVAFEKGMDVFLRKVSSQVHPDKNKGNELAGDAMANLNLLVKGLKKNEDLVASEVCQSSSWMSSFMSFFKGSMEEEPKPILMI